MLGGVWPLCTSGLITVPRASDKLDPPNPGRDIGYHDGSIWSVCLRALLYWCVLLVWSTSVFYWCVLLVCSTAAFLKLLQPLPSALYLSIILFYCMTMFLCEAL